MLTTPKDYKLLFAYALWAAFTLVICIMIVSMIHSNSVSINYWQASNHWLHGEPLYDNSGRGFIYLPQSAILYIPLAILPFPISEVVWRVLSLGIFAYGLCAFSALVVQNHFNTVATTTRISTGACFLFMTCIAIPLAFSSARNGQMHLFMTGILILATVCLSKQQWWKVTVLLLLAFALKPTAIVLLLLTAGLFAEVRWRLCVGVAFFLLLGFITQSPDYVWSQYTSSIISMRETARLGTQEHWAQLFTLFTQLGFNFSELAQTIIRLVVALAVLGLAYGIKRCGLLTQTAIWLFILSMYYLILFNPRTEGNDYIMLAPAIGFIFINAIVQKRLYTTSLLTLLFVALLGSYYIGNAITPGNTVWVDALLATLFATVTLVHLRQNKMRT